MSPGGPEGLGGRVTDPNWLTGHARTGRADRGERFQRGEGTAAGAARWC